MVRFCKPAIALVAVFCGSAVTAAATPLQDCATSSVPTVCLDAKLKAANQRLNATLKAAQERLEQLQAGGRRPVLGTFIDSQRKFNAYRDAQCNWQGIRAPSGANGAEYVKDCQIRATIAREQELAEFLAGDAEPAAAAVLPPPGESESQPEKNTELPAVPGQAAVETSPPAEQPEKPAIPADTSAAGSHANEWRLVKWVVNGVEKPLVPDSTVTIAFDPSGKIAGNASVNRFSGTYHFDVDGRLEWPRTGFALTRAAGPPPLMAQERAFLDALRRTTQYRVEGPQLMLESQSGATLLTFAR